MYTRELQLALAFRSFLSAFACQRRRSGVHSPPRDISTRECPRPAPCQPVHPLSLHLHRLYRAPPGESTDLFKRRSRRETAGFVTAGKSRSILASWFSLRDFYFKLLSLPVYKGEVIFLRVIHRDFLYLIR